MHYVGAGEGSAGALEASRGRVLPSSAEEWPAQADREGRGRQDRDASLRVRR